MSHLLDQVRSCIRLRHYSIRTEEAYLSWIKRYILYHDKRHPLDLGQLDVLAFLTHLAVDLNVAPSTQNQALSALLFLYREVLNQPLTIISQVQRAKRVERLPVVFTKAEVQSVIALLRDEMWLMASLLYGSGLRLMECLRLRVKDIDFVRAQIIVRDGKGGKDRVTMLPPSLVDPLERQLQRAQAFHDMDLRAGCGQVYLPYALARKYPSIERAWAWQYVFPARKRSIEARTNRERRHHIWETALQKAVKEAIRCAGIKSPASCHTFRHYAEYRTMPT